MKAMKIVDNFCNPLELYTIASENIESCFNKIGEIAKSMRADMSAEHVGDTADQILIENGEGVKEINYQDPPQSHCKGRRKRFKHPIEKKMRTCTRKN